jgi:predicted metal-binding protein
MTGVCLQVCVLCGEAAGGEPEAVPAGRRLYDALLAASSELPDITVAPVDCFAVCDRPVTLAFRALDSATRWSYLVGGADPDRDLVDILTAARAVAASPHGVPAMEDRPPFFRNGVIARVPPGD